MGDVIAIDERTLWADEDFGEMFIRVHLEPLLALLRSASSEQGSKIMRQRASLKYVDSTGDSIIAAMNRIFM
jgi:hypothetical protein